MPSKATIIEERIKQAQELLKRCCLCGHRCGADRTSGGLGICGAGKDIYISSYTAHLGEEPVFSGTKGSGTIFFTYCNLSCAYCQNYEISQKHLGKKVSEKELADIMLSLQKKGCHNINLVSPTHFMPQILAALKIAFEKGLDIPVVYNTNGYDSLELLKILDGIADIYMPDFKYFDDEKAKKYSNAENYVETAKAGIKEMFRQAGNLVLDGEDIALKGLLVRHLGLPNNISGGKEVLDFLSSISKDIWISIMSQYSPQNKAKEYPELNRKITPEEYWDVIRHAQSLKLENYLIQEMSSTETYLPDFSKNNPF
ncbi:MAG: radical SAM protein [Candidatus Saganbacteria bacterium]|nr:radical SAM protein [Candidatus Saganbacteria bacterium]